VYRKWAESGNPDDGVRWEMECKGDRAALVASLMIGAADTAGERFVSLLRAFCDFVDRADEARGDRAPLLPWWAALVESVGRWRGVIGKAADSLARRVRWLRKSVAPTLAVFVATLGRAALDELVTEGRVKASLAAVPRYRDESTATMYRLTGSLGA
jgi:hypothetical protein